MNRHDLKSMSAELPWSVDEIVPLATCRPSGLVFRRGLCAGQPSGQQTHQRAFLESWRAIGYSSRFSFRFPQCVFLRSGLNSRST